jgi:hypothetical protein
MVTAVTTRAACTMNHGSMPTNNRHLDHPANTRQVDLPMRDPSQERDVMKLFVRFNEALDEGLSKSIFDHIRNYLMCSFLLAIGIAESNQKIGMFFDLFVMRYSGGALICLAGVLFLLNLLDGIRSISKHKIGMAYTAIFILVYVITSVGVIELASSFRLSM